MRKICLILILLFGCCTQTAAAEAAQNTITLSADNNGKELWEFWADHEKLQQDFSGWYYCEPSNLCEKGFADVIKEVNKIKSFRNLPVGYKIVVPDSLLTNTDSLSGHANHNLKKERSQNEQSFQRHNVRKDDAVKTNSDTNDSLSWKNNTRKVFNGTSPVRVERSLFYDSAGFFNFYGDSTSSFPSPKEKAGEKLQEEWLPKNNEKLDSTIDIDEDRQIKRNNSEVNAGRGENASASQGIERSQKATTGWKKTESISSKEGIETGISTAVIMQKWKQIKFPEKLYGGTLIFVLLLGLIEFFRS